MKGAPRSEVFDDVYFSAEDGLRETNHVFLAGNNLPAAWAGRSDFIIAELGFGTGLNVLATWQAFERTAAPGQNLHIISVEKYPRERGFIEQALCVFAQDLGAYPARMLAAYPPLLPGFHRLALSRAVTLTLIFDEALRALEGLESPPVDAWFLDGFKPSNNPEMWRPEIFAAMARHSRPGSTFATFTAAGAVRRGLEAAGFSVSKVPGFGRKREMLTGVFRSREERA